MIDESKIKEAARAYCDATYGTLKEEPFIAEGFRQGAQWAQQEFINSLWHDASEEPITLSGLIVHDKYENTYYATNHSVWVTWDVYKHSFSIDKWLYIDDLLPKEVSNSSV